jgi:hypothetical protein
MQARLWTLNGLAVELDKDRRSLARQIETLEPDKVSGRGRVTRKYRMARVVAHISGSSSRLEVNTERARKDKESADKLALENAMTRGELGRITEMAEWFGGHIDRCRVRLLQIPDAIRQFCDPQIGAPIVAEAKRLIDEAITELAADIAEGESATGPPLATTAVADDQPMGGRKKNPKSGSVSRAGKVAHKSG